MAAAHALHNRELQTYSRQLREYDATLAAGVTENTADNVLDVMANDTDDGLGEQFVESITQPNYGLVVIGAAGANVEYSPIPDYCNDGVVTDAFTYTLNGGSSTSVSVTVNCTGPSDIIYINYFDN